MEDAEAVDLTQQGLDMLSMWCRNISMMPLEDWLAGLRKADDVGCFIDPTAWMKTVDDRKILIGMLEKALALKKFVVESQGPARQILQRRGQA